VKPGHAACPGRPAAARARGAPRVGATAVVQGPCLAGGSEFRRYHCEPVEALHRVLRSFRHLARCSLQQREQGVVGVVRLRRAANNLILVSQESRDSQDIAQPLAKDISRRR
jgi:hypothetical protein